MSMQSVRRQHDAIRKQTRKPVALNLVSLMDIFTILVFFLLVNSSEVVTLPNTKGVTLPDSTALQQPRETITIMVTDNDIRVDGVSISDVNSALRSSNPVIPSLQTALQLEAPVDEDAEHKEVTILGDKDIRYDILKKVMATCASVDFDRVSLAVMQANPEPSA